MIDIFKVPVKNTINKSLQGKSLMLVGKSKTGKSTVASQAPRPVFLMTENGGEGLTGFTPIPIGSWNDFKQAVSQLCSSRGRETFDSVVIDTATNLILLLDKYIGNKLSSEKTSYDFGSDLDFGKGAKAMKNELGIQLQKLANQGYVLINIVHAEDKVDFNTGKNYVGTSLSSTLYGVMEKFVDQIIYLRRDEDKRGNIAHTSWFNSKGGFVGTGGRFTPEVDSVPTSYKNIERELLKAMDKLGTADGVILTESSTPSIIINNDEEEFDYDSLMAEFNEIANKLVDEDANNITKISKSIANVLGPNRKISSLTKNQVELLYETVNAVKMDFNLV